MNKKTAFFILCLIALPINAYKNHYAQSPSFSAIKKQFEENDAWGLHTIVDLSDCDPQLIRSKEIIHQYILELCDLIDMKRFGDPTITHFGEDKRVAGYSMFQLIETSNIAGHFANDTNTAYIDIFSCKLYDPQIAAEFTKNFFKAKSAETHIILR